MLDCIHSHPGSPAAHRPWVGHPCFKVSLWPQALLGGIRVEKSKKSEANHTRRTAHQCKLAGGGRLLFSKIKSVDCCFEWDTFIFWIKITFLFYKRNIELFNTVKMLQNRPGVGGNDILLPNGPALVLRGLPPTPAILGSPCPPPRKDVSQCQRLVKRKRII